jgi:RimJ/RimL family protein N-acetyltransferase
LSPSGAPGPDPSSGATAGPAPTAPPLRTARLRLAPLRAADARDLAPVLDDEELHRFTGGRPLGEDDLRRRFARWERGRSPDGRRLWLNWVVRLARSGEAIGFVQATVQGRIATIAYVIGRPWQGRGLASEAVRGMVTALRSHFRVVTVRAHVAPAHAASAGVAIAAGLADTGRVTPDGERVWEGRA